MKRINVYWSGSELDVSFSATTLEEFEEQILRVSVFAKRILEHPPNAGDEPKKAEQSLFAEVNKAEDEYLQRYQLNNETGAGALRPGKDWRERNGL